MGKLQFTLLFVLAGHAAGLAACIDEWRKDPNSSPVSENVLKDAKGIYFAQMSKLSAENKRRSGSSIARLEDAIPYTHHGCGSSYVSEFIVTSFGADSVQIVTDPVKNSRTDVPKSFLKKTGQAFAWADIPGKPVSLLFDAMDPSASFKLFSSPDRKSLLSETKPTYLKVDKFKNGWYQVTCYYPKPDASEPWVSSSYRAVKGWMPLRSEDGKFILWFVTSDDDLFYPPWLIERAP